MHEMNDIIFFNDFHVFFKKSQNFFAKILRQATVKINLRRKIIIKTAIDIKPKRIR